MKAATISPVRSGLMADFSDLEFPSQVFGMVGRDAIMIDGPGTMYGYLDSGEAMLIVDTDPIMIGAGSYFSIPVRTRAKVLGGPPMLGFFAFRLGYVGLCLVGARLENRGRLKYIDGCSDTLLIAPPLRGDPCFNLLHFPPGISQTAHTHPSVRAGMIHRGRGVCHTDDGTEPLDTGSVFILAPDAVHAFETSATEMRLTVFHPDSDFGPTHEEHPMLSRTIVGGESARFLPALHTKEIV